MAKPPAKRESRYDLQVALDWGEKIAEAIENATLDEKHRLLFCYKTKTIKIPPQRPGETRCRCTSIGAHPRQLARMQRQLMAAFRVLCKER